MSDDRRYKTTRWKRRRERQLRAEPLCAYCLARGITRAATVADHKIPHRGDDKAFWEGELQSLCESDHNRFKQREETYGYTDQLDPSGWPSDPRHPANVELENRRQGGRSKSLESPSFATGARLFFTAPQIETRGVKP